MDILDDFKQPDSLQTSITIGIVVDNNDAFQMGRLKIRCNTWGDEGVSVENLPMTLYAQAFGGTSSAPRGVGDSVSQGQVAYGMWSVPKLGSRAIVMLIDGDQMQRVWIGTLPDLFLPHTLPHGRYLADKLPSTSTENRIEPLASNLNISFGGNLDSPEYSTRGMDRQVAAIRAQDIGELISISGSPDEINQTLTHADGSVINRRQGYGNTGSDIFSLTTPGFHSFSMDDDSDNCRVKLRTTSGHQIIMDDTNERIYITTAKGNTWIEIDEKGVIDIYGSQAVSINSDGDLNLSAKKTVRIAGGEGVHVTSGSDYRLHTADDINIKSDSDVLMHGENIKAHADKNFEILAEDELQISANAIVISSDTTFDLDVATVFQMHSNGYDFDGSNLNVVGNTNTNNLFALQNVTAGANISALLNVTAGGVISAPSISAAVIGGAVISASGVVFAQGDVVAGTTSLAAHTHSYTDTIPNGSQIIKVTSPAATIPSGGGSAQPTSVNTPDPVQLPLPATPASSTASAAEEQPAYFVSRAPQHEPYPRSFIDITRSDRDATDESALDLFEAIATDSDAVLEYPSDSPAAGTGSAQRGLDFRRNSKWRR